MEAPPIWREGALSDTQLVIANSSCETARNALQLAAEKGNLDIVASLICSGANLSALPCFYGGATALQSACISGLIGLAKFLISRGADVNASGAKYLGRTALEGAAEHGRLDTVRLLLEEGCLIHDSFRKHYILAVGFANHTDFLLWYRSCRRLVNGVSRMTNV